MVVRYVAINSRVALFEGLPSAKILWNVTAERNRGF